MAEISSSDPVYIYIGVVFLFIGVIGFVSNLAIIYIKSKYKHYSNITYTLMIHLAAADSFVLSANSICGGILLFFPKLKLKIVERIFGFFSLFGWYVGSLLLCFIAFSRYITITKNEKVGFYFSKRMKRFYAAFPWIICFAYYSSFLWWPDVLLVKWEPEKVSWDFNGNESYFAYILNWQNVVSSTSCIIVQIIFNGGTLVWLQKTRNTVLTLNQSKNRKRETKLFVQCFINCCLYAGAFLLFMSLNTALDNVQNLPMYVLMSLVWMSHHCANPIIYFLINRQLRQDVKETLTTIGQKLFIYPKNKVSTMTTLSTVSGGNTLTIKAGQQSRDRKSAENQITQNF